MSEDFSYISHQLDIRNTVREFAFCFQLKVFINFMQYINLTYHIRMKIPESLLKAQYDGFGYMWGE